MKFFYFLALMVLVIAGKQLKAQTTYIDNGTALTYTMANGDSIYFAAGTFTGSINCWNANTKITISPNAVFKPAAINGLRSKYAIYGVATFNSFNVGEGFALRNYGSVTVTANSAEVNSPVADFTNYPGATIDFKGTFALNSVTNLVNNGDIKIAIDFNVWSNSTIVNKKSIQMGGNFNSSAGKLNNEGLFASEKAITMGGMVFTNTCRAIAKNGFTFNSGTIYNSGLLWAATGSGNASFTNGATIISTDNGTIKTQTFTNWSIIRGVGYLYITGKSTTSGTVGTSGTTSDLLRIYTVNRTSTTRIFDEQNGTVNASAVYAVFAAPDTVNAANFPCSPEYSMPIILPVQWNSFSVTLVNAVSALRWSAEITPGTKFEIERSSNGIDFTKMASVDGVVNQSDYQYADQVSEADRTPVLYYRVKAVQPDGTHQYSDIKTVRFNTTRAAVLQTWPNPFTSHLQITYKAAQKTQLSMSIYKLDGHLQVARFIQVNAGNNTIEVPEASRLSNGVYIVRISAANGETISSKIIKQ